MIISLQGYAGSGKGTIARMLASRLGYNYYSVGDFRRNKAKELAISLEEYNRLGETDTSTDKDADEYQRRLGLEEDNFVIDGRLCFYFIPHSVKIYLTIDPDEAAKRVFNDKSPTRINQQCVSTLDEQKKLNISRDEGDKLRYRKHYGISDFTDPKNYDLVMNTSDDSPPEVKVERIMTFLKEEGYVK
jgi:predicted cytidylate kinase